MKEVIFFENEKKRILKNRDIKRKNEEISIRRNKIAERLLMLSELCREGFIYNIDIVMTFNGMECYFGEKNKEELFILKDRIDNIEKEIKFE